MKLLHDQPARGHIDDKFAGLSVNGADYPLNVQELAAACAATRGRREIWPFLQLSLKDAQEARFGRLVSIGANRHGCWRRTVLSRCWAANVVRCWFIINFRRRRRRLSSMMSNQTPLERS